jgi:transposase
LLLHILILNFNIFDIIRKNKLYGEEVLGIPSKWVYCALRRNRKYVYKEILGIEKKLLFLAKQEQQVQLTLLTSIPGIGLRTVLFMIGITDGF